ncbi:hypothetical protein CQJ94_15380 [Glycomyces fuscus]|nr:hypothetical protein CQJ94_15380 [Glycomyces fuscus]
MGHKKAWALALGVITLVLFGFWLTPRIFPDLGWGLNELNQIAGIASLPVGMASLLVGLWALRSSVGQNSSTPASGGATNTITGSPSGPTVQAHTMHGGIGNTTHHTADRIDFSGGTFHGPVTGEHEEHHHRPGTTRGDEHP